MGASRAIRLGMKPPLAMRLVDRLPLLQRIPARILGMRFRPEHVEVPAAH